jgi:hypothetical protein
MSMVNELNHKEHKGRKGKGKSWGIDSPLVRGDISISDRLERIFDSQASALHLVCYLTMDVWVLRVLCPCMPCASTN